MAKYRGKHEEKLRGKYTCKSFVSVQENRRDNQDLGHAVGDFIEQRGYIVQLGIWMPVINGDETCSRGSYHIGGASVGVLRRDLEMSWLPERYKGPRHYTRINLVSNDGLDDIIKKILDEFPSFKEIDFGRLYLDETDLPNPKS